MGPSDDCRVILAEILSSYLISSNFELEQSTGAFLGNFMHFLNGDTLYRGFSWYSEEACHESRHGNGTCSPFLAREQNCVGKCQAFFEIVYFTREQRQ